MVRSPGSRTPTAGELRAAIGRTVPDVIAPALKVLFCGINPGLYSAATEHHFARPGNRFWLALYLAGFTPRLLAPHESNDLLGMGYGITSLVRRATATAREIAPSELVAGRSRLARMVRTYPPALGSRCSVWARLSHSLQPPARATGPTARCVGGNWCLAASQPEWRKRQLSAGGSHP